VPGIPAPRTSSSPAPAGGPKPPGTVR
jgi:hypothetical protein